MVYVFKVIGLLFMLCLLSLSTILIIIKTYGKKYIIKSKVMPEKLDSVIILGAGVRKDGNPCDLLADRIKTGVEAHLCTQSNNILLTGEDRDENYNEVKVMKNWVTNNYKDINEEVILLDGLGLCTYDSMYRAKFIYNIKSAIISTNEYHLPRAIYIARKLGIDAYGIKSDLRPYDRMKKYKRRELMAQIKDFLLVNFELIKKFIKA